MARRALCPPRAPSASLPGAARALWSAPLCRRTARRLAFPSQNPQNHRSGGSSGAVPASPFSSTPLCGLCLRGAASWVPQNNASDPVTRALFSSTRVNTLGPTGNVNITCREHWFHGRLVAALPCRHTLLLLCTASHFHIQYCTRK